MLGRMNLYCISILIAVHFMVCYCEVTPEQKKQLLDAHNNYRRQVAQGKTSGQPGAANMLELKWSNEAAARAQRHVSKCQFGHDQGSDRKYGKHQWVNQNIAYWHSNDVTEGVKMWFDEVKNYDFNTKRCRGVCGHYTQVVWAKTVEMGCGIADCKSRGLGPIYLACNYGPGGNWNNENPYEVGQACSKCPSGTKCTNGLCA